MSTYTITRRDGEYVDITIRIADQTFNQSLCGMPTDDAQLQAKLTDYVADYETNYLQATTPAPAATDPLIGQVIVATDTPVIEPVVDTPAPEVVSGQ